MASIRQRKGKWQVQIRRKGLTPISKTFESKSQAQVWATQMEGQIDMASSHFDPGVLKQYLVSDLLKRYRETVTITKRSRRTEEIRIGAFLRHPISDLTLAEVNSAHFADYRDMRLKQVSSGTVHRDLAIWQNVFTKAMQEWGLPIVINPISRIAKPAPSKPRSRRLLPDEETVLLDACGKARNKLILPIVRFALETAMRKGEIISVRHRNWNEQQRLLTIEQTKNGESRTIPLSSAANEILREQNHDSGQLFPIGSDGLRCAWVRTVKRAKLKDLRFHDLRHEAISRLFEAGLSIPEVALISGHKTYSQLAVYTHINAAAVLPKLR